MEDGGYCADGVAGTSLTPKAPHTGTVGFATLAGACRELHPLLFNLGGPVGGHQVRPSHAAAGLELTEVRNGS